MTGHVDNNKYVNMHHVLTAPISWSWRMRQNSKERKQVTLVHSFVKSVVSLTEFVTNNVFRILYSDAKDHKIISRWICSAVEKFLQWPHQCESGSRLCNLDSTLCVHLHNFTQVLCLPVCSWSHSPHRASHNFTVAQLFTSLLAGNHGELTSCPGTAPWQWAALFSSLCSFIL